MIYIISDKYPENLIKLLNMTNVQQYNERMLTPGVDWKEVLRQKMNECQFFLYVLNANTYNNSSCQFQLDYAKMTGKKILCYYDRACLYETVIEAIGNQAKLLNEKPGNSDEVLVEIVQKIKIEMNNG